MILSADVYCSGLSKNYKEKYLKMKDNYNDIFLLYYEIDTDIALNRINEDNFKNHSEVYIKLLNGVENHLERDYLKYAIKDSNVSIDFWTCCKYYVTVIFWRIVSIMVIIPAFVLLFLMLSKL